MKPPDSPIDSRLENYSLIASLLCSIVFTLTYCSGFQSYCNNNLNLPTSIGILAGSLALFFVAVASIGGDTP